MYTQQEIDKALQLYEQIHSIRKVVKRLGYPSKAQLELWLKEKRLTGQVTPKNKWSTADIQVLREEAVSCFVKHHRNYSATLNELGYAVSRVTLYRWQKEYFPELCEKTLVEEPSQPIQHSLEIKKQAVEAMRLSGQSVIRIAREFGWNLSVIEYGIRNDRTTDINQCFARIGPPFTAWRFAAT